MRGQPHSERTDSPARTLEHSFKVRHGEPWTTGKEGHLIDCSGTEKSARVASFPRQNISKPGTNNGESHTYASQSLCTHAGKGKLHVCDIQTRLVMLHPDLLCALNWYKSQSFVERTRQDISVKSQ